MDPAASVAPGLHLVVVVVVFSGSLAADLHALVFGARTPAVFEAAVVLEALGAVSSDHTDVASVDLAVEFADHVASLWVHIVAALEGLREFGALDGTQALRIDAAWVDGVQM